MTHIIERNHPTKPYLVRWFEPKQGQRSFATREEAESFMTIRGASESLGGSELFRDYATRWNIQTALGKDKAPSSVRGYEGMFRNHIFPVLGNVPLAKITREMCKNLLLSSGLSPSVATLVQDLLNAILNEAVADKRIPENPAKGIPVTYTTHVELVPMTYDQLIKIGEEFKPEHRLFLWIQLGIGARVGESLAVKASNINADGTMIRIEEQVAAGRKAGEPILRPCKHRKRGDYRDIPLPVWLHEMIRQHMQDFDIEPGGYLFPDFAVKGCWPQPLSKRMRSATALAGCPKVHFHMLRHLYASMMLRDGIPLTDVSRYLGHRSIELTHQVYGHWMPTGTSRAIEASERAMSAFKAA